MVDPGTTVETYLRRRAEPEAEAGERIEGEFGHALVVPAYGEGESLFATLGSVPKGPRGDVLVVVVLNARADSPERVHAANRAARERLLAGTGAASALSTVPPITSVPSARGVLLLVDRACPGHFLPAGQGVGLARKIGSDLVMRLRRTGRLASDWIHTTDADVLLPDDYFGRVGVASETVTVAALYPFEHRFDPDEALARAGRLHEISLRYRVLGLAWAGSPYAYQTMGSCLAIGAPAYARVGGFPKRNATEDVHVLNSLAKAGGIARLGGAPLTLEGPSPIACRSRRVRRSRASRAAAPPPASDSPIRSSSPIWPSGSGCCPRSRARGETSTGRSSSSPHRALTSAATF